LFFYACIVSGLLFACQGKQGDPGPAGAGTITTSEATYSGSNFTFNSITGWWFTGNWPIGKWTDPDGKYWDIDTNSVVSVSLYKKVYYQNPFNSPPSVGFLEEPLPYVDPSTGVRYSFNKSLNPPLAFYISINILGTTTLPSELIFKYYFTTSN